MIIARTVKIFKQLNKKSVVCLKNLLSNCKMNLIKLIYRLTVDKAAY